MLGLTAKWFESAELATSCLDRAPQGILISKEASGTNQGEESRTFQHVKTDSSQSVDIRVVYFGQEANLRGSHGIVLG
jgi:hypothetical protein